MISKIPSTSNRDKLVLNFSTFWLSPEVSKKRIVMVFTCSGMNATNSISRNPTDFRSQTIRDEQLMIYLKVDCKILE